MMIIEESSSSSSSSSHDQDLVLDVKRKSTAHFPPSKEDIPSGRHSLRRNTEDHRKSTASIYQIDEASSSRESSNMDMAQHTAASAGVDGKLIRR